MLCSARMKKLLLIDGNAIFHRAFHALPLFKTKSGEYTNAVYGFLKMFIEIVTREKPEYVAVAFDRAAPTFRHVEYKEYKATRAAPPEELYPQLPRLKEVLETFNIQMFELDGYEADDIIGTIAEIAGKDPEILTLILTGDRDALQLVTPKTWVVAPVKGVSEVIEYTPEMVKEKTGLNPNQIVDYKSLKGDASDNIKGVPGIGEKTAVELLQKYEHLEGIYKHLNELTPGQRKKLEEGEKDAEQSRRLATIIRNVPIEVHLEACRLIRATHEKAKKLFETLEFKGLLKLLDTLKELVEPEEKAQQSMF